MSISSRNVLALTQSAVVTRSRCALSRCRVSITPDSSSAIARSARRTASSSPPSDAPKCATRSFTACGKLSDCVDATQQSASVPPARSPSLTDVKNASVASPYPPRANSAGSGVRFSAISRSKASSASRKAHIVRSSRRAFDKIVPRSSSPAPTISTAPIPRSTARSPRTASRRPRARS